MSVYTVSAEVRAVTDLVNNRIDLEFRNPSTAAYYSARLREAVALFNDSDSMLITFAAPDGTTAFAEWDHSGAWVANTQIQYTTGASVVTIHNAGNETRETALNNFYRFTEMRISSGPSFGTPVARSTFTAVTTLRINDLTEGLIVFGDDQNAADFVDAVTRNAYRYDKQLSYIFRWQDQSASVAALNFPGFNLPEPGIGAINGDVNRPGGNNIVALNYIGTAVLNNNLDTDQVRTVSNFRIYDRDSDELFLADPRFNPAEATGESRWSRPRSRRQTVADRRGDSSWAGNTSMRNPQAKPLTRIPYVNPFRDGDE